MTAEVEANMWAVRDVENIAAVAWICSSANVIWSMFLD